MNNKSFTLIELLVVIVIIGILAGVIMISTSSSINKANIAKSKVFEESVANDLAANMVSRWTLDEINGITTPDAWGSIAGTLGDGITTTTYPTLLSEPECISDKCMRFDGGDYIDCGNNSNLNIRNEITLSAWINVSAYPSSRGRIIFKYSPGSYDLEISSSGQIYSASLYENIGWQGVYSTTNVDLGKWYYINFVFNGKQGMIYFNGLRNSPIASIVAKLSSSSAPTRIGATFESGIPVQFFNGKIDDVRIYDAALSSSQIKQNYIAGLDSLLSKGSISKEDYNQRINELAYNEYE